jgi:NAD(P)-dependent dehydrogenase (short-subunit alcohol dehydrogenase family)
VVDKNKDTAEETAKLGKLQGSDARAFPCDVSDRAEVRKASREIDEAFRRIGFLVNNAEVFIHETREQSTDEVIDLHSSASISRDYSIARRRQSRSWSAGKEELLSMPAPS